MPSFASDIRALFRAIDVDSMRWALDLSQYEQVKARAEEVYGRLASGTMPCDSVWPPARLALFRRWIDEGCQP
jgi:hypothetical protein